MVIWRDQLATARQALAQAGLQARDIHAIGITNQRETTVLWNRRTGLPVHHAIVWQDRRAENTCAALRADGRAALIQQKTGLLIDAYFSGSKLKWLLDTVPGARQQAERGDLAFGTIDSWLLWQLTGGALHATDVSNASRTMLFNVHSNTWDTELMALLDIPASLMPAVLPSSAQYGQTAPELLGAAVPIGGVAGDQQSALFGQACFSAGMAKNTYGTGCFMLMHTGSTFQTSHNGLLTTSAAQTSAQPQFALEGSVFVGGAVVQWLRDGLGAIQSSSEVEALGQPEARGSITGLTRGSTLAHIARAALESIAYQSAALLLAMSRDAVAAGAAPMTELRVDGGACGNDLLMQFQADLLGIAVVRPVVTETTALGAAYLAGLSGGLYAGTEELSALWRAERSFVPAMSRDQAAGLMARWEHAVRQASLQ
jgi:glycerol kinase